MKFKISLRRTKFFLAGIGIAAFLGVLIALILNYSVSQKTIKPPVAPENPQGADIQINKIHYTSTNEQGVKEWELKADTASYFQEEKMAGFKGVSVTFYSQEGRTFSLRGDTGVLNTETKDFELSGNVVGTSNDGYHFRTESLTYQADKHQAKSDKKVFLESPQLKLEGIGMIMNLKEEKLLLLKNVVARGNK